LFEANRGVKITFKEIKESERKLFIKWIYDHKGRLEEAFFFYEMLDP